MYLITICLLAGYPCQDQIRYGLYDTPQECAAKIQSPVVQNRLKKYNGKVRASCREIWVRKLT